MPRKDEAYEYLKNAILTNELPPDTPISELAVSQTLQMSRTPIREALRELESEGLIVSYPARGSFVASMTPYDVEEIYDLRMLLEQWAFERSICRINESDLVSIEKDFEKAHRDSNWELFHATDRALHNLIVERAGSKRLLEFVKTLNSQIERVRRISARDQGRSQRSYEEHMQIIDSIRKRDVAGGKKILQHHLRSVADSAIEAARYQVTPVK